MDIKSMIEDAGGTVKDGPHRLPDGSGFMVASFPLPKDHWLYDSAEMRPPVGRREIDEERVRAAAKYAIRAATLRGNDMDFDPDAMMQCFVAGMRGEEEG